MSDPINEGHPIDSEEETRPPEEKKTGRPKGSIQKPKWVWKRVRVDDLPRNPTGSPGKYSKKIAKKICHEVATTARGIQEICETNPSFPSYQTVYGWLYKKPGFFEMWSIAKIAQAELLADQIIRIADTPKLGQITTTSGRDAQGKPIVKEVRIVDMVEHRRLQIENRKWMASKLLPKKFGERIEVNDGRDPLAQLINELNAQHSNPPAPENSKPVDPADQRPSEPNPDNH